MFHAEISESNSGQFADGSIEVRKIINHAHTLHYSEILSLPWKRGEKNRNLHGFHKFLSSTKIRENRARKGFAQFFLQSGAPGLRDELLIEISRI